MEDTIRRLGRVLGASSIEAMGRDARFDVDGADGSRLHVVVDGANQRFLAELKDPNGVLRADIDVGPIARVTEDADVPGRVTLHVGHLIVHVESKPNLAIEIVAKP